MEDVKDKIAGLTEHVEDAADTFYKLTMVNLVQKTTNIAAGTITVLAICTAGVLVLFFGGLALSWWLGDVVGSRAGGFLLGALFFIIVTIVIILCRKNI